jgi:hypothetical protein
MLLCPLEISQLLSRALFARLSPAAKNPVPGGRLGDPEGALTKGLPPNEDGFVKTTKFDTTSEQARDVHGTTG